MGAWSRLGSIVVLGERAGARGGGGEGELAEIVWTDVLCRGRPLSRTLVSPNTNCLLLCFDLRPQHSALPLLSSLS